MANKVLQSGLITIDLDEWVPKGEKVILDIKDWLYEELILKEKIFRENLNATNWEKYQGKFVAMSCSVEVVLPKWTYLLVACYLQPYAKKVLQGNLAELEKILYKEAIQKKDFSEFKDQRVIISGCGKKLADENPYILLIEKLWPVAKSIMYGEACSSVPLFKRRS